MVYILSSTVIKLKRWDGRAWGYPKPDKSNCRGSASSLTDRNKWTSHIRLHHHIHHFWMHQHFTSVLTYLPDHKAKSKHISQAHSITPYFWLGNIIDPYLFFAYITASQEPGIRHQLHWNLSISLILSRIQKHEATQHCYNSCGHHATFLWCRRPRHASTKWSSKKKYETEKSLTSRESAYQQLT